MSLKTRAQNPNKLSWVVMWAAASLLLLLPLWLFPYIPTQDGPAHLETAAHLLELKGSTFLQGFYHANWQLATNQVYHGLLVALGSFLPLLFAEKLLLSAYALLVPLTTLFAVRGLKGAPFAVFLVLPAVYSYVFYLGFYNLCFGLPLFLLALGFYFRLADASNRSLAPTLLLALTLILTYFVHVIAAVNTLLALGILALLRLIVRGDRRTFGLSLSAVVPVTALLLFFFVQTPRTMPTETTKFLPLFGLIRAFFVQLPNPFYALYSPLVTHTWLDAVFTLPLIVLMLGFVFFVLVKRIRAKAVPIPELLGAVTVFFFIVVWTPNRLGEVGWLPDRFLPYAYALVVLWVSTFELSARRWRTVAATGLTLWGALMLYRLPVHAALNGSVKEYLAVARSIDDESTVLPLYLTRDSAPPPGLRALYPNMRYDELRHALGYIALDKRIVDLVDYQAAKAYFPITYDAVKDPSRYLSEGGLKALEYPPFTLDIAGYAEKTGATVDYVLLWGDLDAVRQRSDVQNMLQQLTDYELVFVSEPRGLLHLYARRELAP